MNTQKYYLLVNSFFSSDTLLVWGLISFIFNSYIYLCAFIDHSKEMQFRYICLIFYHYEWLYLSKAIKPILAMVGLNLLNELKEQDEGHWNMYESSMKLLPYWGYSEGLSVLKPNAVFLTAFCMHIANISLDTPNLFFPPKTRFTPLFIARSFDGHLYTIKNITTRLE